MQHVARKDTERPGWSGALVSPSVQQVLPRFGHATPTFVAEYTQDLQQSLMPTAAERQVHSRCCANSIICLLWLAAVVLPVVGFGA